MLHNAIRLHTRRKWMWNLEQPQESFFQSSHNLLSIDKAVTSVCAFYYSVIMGVNGSRLKRNQNHNL